MLLGIARTSKYEITSWLLRLSDSFLPTASANLTQIYAFAGTSRKRVHKHCVSDSSMLKSAYNTKEVCQSVVNDTRAPECVRYANLGVGDPRTPTYEGCRVFRRRRYDVVLLRMSDLFRLDEARISDLDRKSLVYTATSQLNLGAVVSCCSLLRIYHSRKARSCLDSLSGCSLHPPAFCLHVKGCLHCCGFNVSLQLHARVHRVRPALAFYV